MCEGIVENTTLQMLILSSNGITYRSATKLVGSLMGASGLEVLNLSTNDLHGLLRSIALTTLSVCSFHFLLVYHFFPY